MDLSKLIGKKEETAEEYTPTMTKEEYAAMKKEQREELWAGINAKAQEVFSDGPSMQSFLDFTARCAPQRTANLFLLYGQNPEITQVKTFDKWKEAGRSIKGGQSGYTFLVSENYERDDGSMGQGYNIEKAFDISQTRGRQPQPIPQRSADELLAAMITESPVRLEISDQLPDGIQAQYVPRSRTVFVRNRMEEAATFHAISRELAHATFANGNPSYSRRDFSAQAYCAAYVVGQKYGMDVSAFSFDKVCAMNQGQEPEALRLFVADVKSAAYTIEQDINRGLGELEQTADKDFSVAEQAAKGPKAKATKSKAKSEQAAVR